MANIISARPFTSMAAKKRNTFGVAALFGLARQRRALAKLDARLLEDVGIAHTAARREAARPVWDVPAHWSA